MLIEDNYYINSIGRNRAVMEQLVTDMNTDIIESYVNSHIGFYPDYECHLKNGNMYLG